MLKEGNTRALVLFGFGDPSNSFGSLVDNQLLSAKPENTFLIKATYRFVL